MKQIEIARVGVVRTANIVTAIYCVFMMVFLICAWGLFIATESPLPDRMTPHGTGAAAFGPLSISRWLIPNFLFGLIYVWISIAIAAVVYNLIARSFGGIRFSASDIEKV
jgi:hypothetical protein